MSQRWSAVPTPHKGIRCIVGDVVIPEVFEGCRDRNEVPNLICEIVLFVVVAPIFQLNMEARMPELLFDRELLRFELTFTRDQGCRIRL